MMWILGFLSDFVIHTVFVLGVIGTLASFFIPTNPLTMQYGLITKIVSIILLVVGVFFEGTIFKDKIWEARISEAQQRVLEMEKKSAEVNGKIQYVYITKKQEIANQSQQIQTQIKTDAQSIDASCVVIPEAINILNKSAKGVQK